MTAYKIQTAPLLPYYDLRGTLHVVNGLEGVTTITAAIEVILQSVQGGQMPSVR
jgi:hypothetical protein